MLKTIEVIRQIMAIVKTNAKHRVKLIQSISPRINPIYYKRDEQQDNEQGFID